MMIGDQIKIRPKLMQIAAVLMVSLLPPTPNSAYAQTPSSGSNSLHSLTDQVIERSKRLREFVTLIGDKDASIRTSAMQMALTDTDPAVKGLAISAYLKRFNALTPEVVLDTGSPMTQENVPRLVIQDIKWSEDGNSFTGVYPASCGFNQTVLGQIAGGKVSINYANVCIRASLLTKSTDGTPFKGDALNFVGCQLTLSPDQQNTSLEGNLHCVSMALAPKVQLPFGA